MLGGAWETLDEHDRCRFRGTIRLTVTSLLHPEQPVRTMQRSIELVIPTPTPYLLVEPVLIIDVSSSEEDPEEDPDALPPDMMMDAPDAPEDHANPLHDVDPPEDMISDPEAESTEDSGPTGAADSDDSSAPRVTP